MKRRFDFKNVDISYIDGLLLSDGNILLRDRPTAYYRQCCKYIEWLYNIKSDFSTFGIESSVYDKVPWGTYNSDMYSFRSLSYVEFICFKRRWYGLDDEWYDNKGRHHQIWMKCVPKDIKLTPSCVANWYIGDGSLNKRKYKQVSIAVMKFNKDDKEFLSESLNGILDIKSSLWKSGSIGITNRRDVEIFIDYIYEYKVSCYNYKFNI